MKILTFLLSLMLPVTLLAAPVPVIYDTDMSGDCDDVGALAVLNRLADLGEAEILACVANGKNTDAAIAAAISAINTWYGRPNIPIGTERPSRVTPTSKSPYAAHLRDEFPHSAKPDGEMPSAVEVYRKTLAAAADGSVTIVSVGFLTNLRDLLNSPGDAISPLSGADLVRQKVRLLSVMGGAFPGKPDAHPEYNVAGAAPCSQEVIDAWPGEILFSGFEIGSAIMTGKSLMAIPNNPVRRAYELYCGQQFERQSWDLTAALAAVRNPELYWNVRRDGWCKVSPKGVTEWFQEPNRHHGYLEVKLPPLDMVAILNQLIAAPPRK